MRAEKSIPKTTMQRYTIKVVFHKIGAEPILFKAVESNDPVARAIVEFVNR